MKAVFMTEFGGKLMEVERREIKPTNVYYCAVREPISMRVAGDEVPEHITVRREKWVAYSIPNHPKGFAVFLFEGVE